MSRKYLIFFENSKTFKILKNGRKYHHFTVYNIHIELEMKKIQLLVNINNIIYLTA